MKVLVACEFSGTVRDAFIAKGHDAMSCDLEPTLTPGPHYQGNVYDVLYANWDLIIAFPPCTHLAASGTRYFAEKHRDGRQAAAISFFMQMINAPASKVAVENPVGIMSSIYRKPDQIIQPWQYGHPHSKKTCLWLRNLPQLNPTSILSLPECGHWENQTREGQNKVVHNGVWQQYNDPITAKIRSETYQGIADAMAKQWGAHVLCAKSPAQNTMEICHTAPNTRSLKNAQLAMEL